MHADIPRRDVPFVDLPAQFAAERDALLPIVIAAFQRGDFIGGAAIDRLEHDLARRCGVAHVVTLNSGTDALMFGMMALGIGRGDEVITPANSFVASTAAIVHVGATPVFADVGPDQNIDPDAVAAKVTSRTKAIMPVHLTGRICEMAALQEIARKHNLKIVEDAAQSVGSTYRGLSSGAFGAVGCFSMHPLKNLNAAGDAGFLTTADAALADRVRKLRNHGMVDRDTIAEFGFVSRLDTVQAAILQLRLDRLDDVVARRRRNAARYRRLLDPAHIYIPPDRPDTFDSFHTFVVQVDRRDALKSALGEQGIGTAIHYPRPIHLQPAAAKLGYRLGDLPVTEMQAGRILSLPIHQFMSEDDIGYVAACTNAFFLG